MIVCNQPESGTNPETKRFFTDKNAAGFYEWQDWDAEKGLERLVFSVSRNPKNLEAHLERIYYCYQEKLSAQLFGGLVDLLIVLNTSGKPLAKRMIQGCRSELNDKQFESLSHYLGIKDSIANQVNSCYSVFTKGLQSNAALVKYDG